MVILAGMKTAISLPDALFRAADRLAARLGVSRSQLYARALADYLERHDQAHVTARLDALFGPAGAGSDLDPALATAALSVLAEEDW